MTPQTRFNATSRGRKTPVDEMSNITTDASCTPPAGMGHDLHVLGYEFLAGGQKVTDHVRDRVFHGVGVENHARDGEHHHDEREQGQDGIGGDAEGVGMHFSLGHVASKTPDFLSQASVAG